MLNQTRETPSYFAHTLIFGGVLLLAVGGMLSYPYLKSRLAAPAPLTPQVTTTQLPDPTATLPSTSPTPLVLSTATAMVVPPSATPSPTEVPIPPSRIVIPAISVDAPIVPVSWYTVETESMVQAMWVVPDQYAAGWHETSAMPGMPGNTVLSGHNTTYGEVFRDLYTLQAGAVITIYAGDMAYPYAVTEMHILPEAGQPIEVRIENAQYILPTTDERLTLVTCHPYGSLRNRLIVIAHPLE